MDELEKGGAPEDKKQRLRESIEMLCFKLCYMYYNWSAAIKVPAPVCYAQKLSELIGEKCGKFQPKKELGEKKSLYFI